MLTPPPSRFEGFFYDGQSAMRRPAAIVFAADSLHVEIDAETFRQWPYSGLTVTGAEFGDPARVQHEADPGEFVSVPAPDFAHSIGQYLPFPTRSRSRLPAWPATAACCLGVAALLALFYLHGIRWAAEIAAPYTPVAIERKLGASAVAILAPVAQRCSNPERERQLAAIADRLADASGSLYPFEIVYVRNPMMNAFAAPGGFIVVFDGLLEGTETPEEFAGVLAHEMQHVLKHHSTRALARRLSGRSLFSLMAVDGSPAAIEAGAALAGLQHLRSDEEEADRDSIPLLARAGIATGGLSAFLRRLHAATGSNEPPLYLSTHPPTLERAARLADAARRSHAPAEPLMPISEWDQARRICAP